MDEVYPRWHEALGLPADCTRENRLTRLEELRTGTSAAKDTALALVVSKGDALDLQRADAPFNDAGVSLQHRARALLGDRLADLLSYRTHATALLASDGVLDGYPLILPADSPLLTAFRCASLFAESGA